MDGMTIQTEPRRATFNFDGLSDDALVRLKNLIALKFVPFSPSTLWRKVRKGEFPAPIKVSAGVTAWRVGDIRAWLKSPADFNAHGRSLGRAR
jgi:predicted DNA-binding transcriptional regulator AlpA